MSAALRSSPLKLPTVPLRSHDERALDALLQRPTVTRSETNGIHDLLIREQTVSPVRLSTSCQTNPYLWNLLIGCYRRCGCLEDARSVFDSMGANRNVVTWNSVMSAYVHHGRGEEALRIFYDMKRGSISPNRSTFVTCIASCSLLVDLNEGEIIHSHVVELGLYSESLICSALLKMYVKCGEVENARHVFSRMNACDAIALTSMMIAYIKNGHSLEAKKLFWEMLAQGVKPDEVTFGSILGACESPLSLQEGRTIHATVVEDGCEPDGILGTALIDMYRKCGGLNDGFSVFHRMDLKDVVCWTTMIMAFVDLHCKEDALCLYHSMQCQGILCNEVTVVALSGLCDCREDLSLSKMIHVLAMHSAPLRSNAMINTVFINMYGKCGACELSQKVFDKEKDEAEDDLVLWNAMITTFAHQGEGLRAFELFNHLKCRGMKPDHITFSGLLGACIDLSLGKAIHTIVLETTLASNTIVGNAIVNMYSNCGSMYDACIAFERISKRDVISWNAFITSHCRHGHGDQVLPVLKKMDKDGVKPDHVTFLCLLSACSHAGRPQEGYYLYMLMSAYYNILPDLGHYCCMVDMLGRVGYLYDAERIIKEMPFEPDYIIYTTLLNACKIHDDVIRGERIAKLVFNMDSANSESYILLSNIYATHFDYPDADGIRSACNQFQTLELDE